MFALIPALGLWVPIGYLLFVIFSHMIPLASAVVLSFIIPLLIPCLRLVYEFNKRATLLISALLIVVGLILAHINSGYSPSKPLQTFLTYVLNSDENKASWVSEQSVPDEWTKQFFKAEARENVELFGNATWKMWRADAPIISSGTGIVKILRDTLSGTTRNLTLLITADSVTNSIDITAPASATIKKVNNRLLNEDVKRLSFWSIPKEGIEVTLEAVVGEELNLKLTARKIGLPETLIAKKLPDNMIYGPGRLCNTVLVRNTVKL